MNTNTWVPSGGDHEEWREAKARIDKTIDVFRGRYSRNDWLKVAVFMNEVVRECKDKEAKEGNDNASVTVPTVALKSLVTLASKPVADIVNESIENELRAAKQ